MYSLGVAGAERVRRREAKLAVIGLGRIGLPLAVRLAGAGFSVTGVDVSAETVAGVNAGRTALTDEKGLGEALQEAVHGKRLRATLDYAEAGKADVVLVVVPTTLTKERRADIEPVKRAAERLGAVLQGGEVVMLLSTVPPLTTEGVFQELLERGGKRAGKDFGLAFSPERVNAPNVFRDLAVRVPIVGGADAAAAAVAKAVVESYAPEAVVVSSTVAAETAKVAENMYRDVTIALANELALACEKLGVDAYEVIRAVNTQEVNRYPMPGAGVGGHCIPLDPWYLINVARERGAALRLATTAREVNDGMPLHVHALLQEAAAGERVKRVAVLGVAFKEDIVGHEEFSHVFPLLDALRRDGAEVVCYDPHVSGERMERFFHAAGAKSVEEAVSGAGAVVIMTKHREFERLRDWRFAERMAEPRVVVDGRGLLDPGTAPAGVRFRGVGR